MYHPNSNKRQRLRENLRCLNYLRQYRHGLPQREQNGNGNRRECKFTVVRPDGHSASFTLPSYDPIRAGRNDITVYSGTLPIEALVHLYSHS